MVLQGRGATGQQRGRGSGIGRELLYLDEGTDEERSPWGPASWALGRYLGIVDRGLYRTCRPALTGERCCVSLASRWRYPASIARAARLSHELPLLLRPSSSASPSPSPCPSLSLSPSPPLPPSLSLSLPLSPPLISPRPPPPRTKPFVHDPPPWPRGHRRNVLEGWQIVGQIASDGPRGSPAPGTSEEGGRRTEGGGRREEDEIGMIRREAGRREERGSFAGSGEVR